MNNSIIEKNHKLGFYTVDNQIFYSKPEAYIFASKNKKRPVWHFNNSAFARCTWDVEPETDIRELYRLRAQQIRDRYDYLRLELSGGSDSTTVLFSFLLNGIPLDEVVFRYPKGGEKDFVGDRRNYSAENTLSEWVFAAQPLLHWIKTNYPNVKVTMHDYSDKMFKSNHFEDESWIFTSQDWFQPGHGAKHDNFDNPLHRSLADSGKSIGVIYGIDKPKLALIDDHWYTYFVDIHANHPNPVVNEYTNITTELFYWTPDLPELAIKQGHMVKNWFDMPGNQHLKNLVAYPLSSPNLRTIYEGLIKPFIYPDYDPQTWQTAKPTNSFYNEMDTWFYVNLKGSRQYQVWQAGLKFLEENINAKHLIENDGIVNGLRWNKSIFYHLGPSTSVTPKLPLQNHDYKQLRTEEITLLQDRQLRNITV